MARKKLSAAEKAVIESMSDLVIVVGLDGNIEMANKACEGAFDRKFKDLVGKNISELVSGAKSIGPGEIGEFMSLFKEVIKKGSSVDVELNLPMKGGVVTPMSISVGTMKGTRGKPTHVIAVLRDIAARKRTEADLAHEHGLLRSLLDNTPDKIYFKDKEDICNGD